MKVRIPKEYFSLSAAGQRKILEYHQEFEEISGDEALPFRGGI